MVALTIGDLENAKKHDTFHSEVITGKAGGLASGASVDYATNAVTGQIQKTLPKLLDDIDWSYVGLFSDGVTFTKGSDLAVDAMGVQWAYVGGDPFPKVVPAATVPSSPDYQVVNQGVSELSMISRSLNASDGDVIYDSNKTTLIPPYIYAASQQKIYSVPAGAVGGVISSVVGSTLNTTVGGPYNLIAVSGTVTVPTFADAVSFSGSGFDTIETLGHTEKGIGPATYKVDGTTGPASTGNEIKFFGADGRGWLNTVRTWFNAEMAGVLPNTDIFITYQKAIDLAFNARLNVILPSGSYTSTGAFKRQKGQKLIGMGIPQRGISPSNAVQTEITFTNDTEAFEDATNIAIAGGVSMMSLFGIGATTSTKTGLVCGIEGSEGGSSQPLQTLFEDLHIKGFDTCFGLYGWAWGTTLRRVFTDSFKTAGIHLAGAANAVHLDNCHAVLGAAQVAGARTGVIIDGCKNVVLTAPRIENNRRGLLVDGGSVVNVTSLYSEGNRTGDIEVRGEGTICSVDGMLAQHQNEGQNTAFIFKTASTNRSSSLRVNNVKVIVTAGLLGSNNTLNYMLESNTDCNVEITNIDWHGDGGSLWPNFTGRYAPDLITFAQLPLLKITRIGTSYSSTQFKGVTFMNDDGNAAPPSSCHTLINYDGGTIDLAFEGSRVINTHLTNGVNYFKRSSGAWVAVNE